MTVRCARQNCDMPEEMRQDCVDLVITAYDRSPSVTAVQGMRAGPCATGDDDLATALPRCTSSAGHHLDVTAISKVAVSNRQGNRPASPMGGWTGFKRDVARRSGSSTSSPT